VADLFGEMDAAPEISGAMPLAARMRPRALDEVVGQEEVIGDGKPLRVLLDGGTVPSMLFWGPPGSGKTTLARILARHSDCAFSSLSAVTSGVKDIKGVVEQAKYRRVTEQRGTILFVDEIHRFNKSQQDALLPHVEDGTLILVGATTENPSFEVNAALLSRCRVFVLAPLTDDALSGILERALEDEERGLGRSGVRVDDDAVARLIQLANGDARSALNLLEIAAGAVQVGTEDDGVVTLEVLEEVAQRQFLRYDKSGEEHFNIISALHKSLRGGDPDAGMYWMSRMLEGGEDPLYIARRLVRFASEDVGLADPRALQIALSAKEAVHFIGMPEGGLALAQAVVYLAAAPKSNSLYTAYKSVQRTVKDTLNLPVPLYLRNAPTRLMKDLGYGKGYQYAHDSDDGITDQEYLPEPIAGSTFYDPGDMGFERDLAERLAWWKARRREAKGD
jgi:putative ATPase